MRNLKLPPCLGCRAVLQGVPVKKPHFDSPSFQTVIRSWLQYFSQSPPKKTSDEPEVEPSKSAKAPTAEQLEQAKKFFAGFRIGMAVEVQGNLVRTNSVYQDGTKVTLLEMDFSELLSNDALLQQAAAIKGQNLEEAKELLKGLKGFKINLDPEVSIEFSE